MIRAIEQKDYLIADGDEGIYQTVSAMWEFALRDTSESQVKDLVSRLRGRTDFETLKNIYDWVWKNVEYELDPPDRELITAPIHFVNGNKRSGDCDCMTTLLVCLLETAGFESAITVIAWRVDDYTHVFAEVRYDGEWFVLDPTLKENGFGSQDKKIRRYKRLTKNSKEVDMQKLTVLSDDELEGGVSSAIDSSSGADSSDTKKCSKKKFVRIPHKHHRSGKCVSDDDNKNHNHNNVNINFGTSVENSHNDTRSVENSGVPVSPDALPVVNYWWENRPVSRKNNTESPNNVLRPSVFRPDNFRTDVVRKPAINRVPGSVAVNLPRRTDVMRLSPDNVSVLPSADRVYVLKGSKPVGTPVQRRKSSGYIEFP